MVWYLANTHSGTDYPHDSITIANPPDIHTPTHRIHRVSHHLYSS